MNISGWAFKENGDQIAEERRKKYEELNRDDFEIINVEHGYSQNEYELVIKNENIKPLDMLLYCDNGNTCFGGRVGFLKKDEQGNLIYLVIVYTD